MRILLVDDDPSVLQALMAILKTIPGHEVKLAANAQKAHENAAAMGGCDLLITDVVMEPTDGFTLRGELQALYPRMRTVFISGYDLSDYSEQTSNAHVLAKPVDANVLKGLIAGNLNELVAAGTGAAQVGGPSGGISSTAPRSLHPTVQAAAAAPSGVRPAMPAAGARAMMPDGDPLLGVQLGDYRVQQLIGKGTWGAVYLAIQLSVNRPVGLKVLNPNEAQDDHSRSRFLSDARAKAAVQHPFIVSVFEADERNGLVFYTHEFIDGATLEEMIASGQKFDEKAALHVMKVAGEGLNYLWSHNLAHSPLEANSVRIGRDGIPRLANLATSSADPSASIPAEIQTLSVLVGQLVAPEGMSPGLRALLARMTSTGPNAANSWPVVLQAVRALEPKVIPVEAAKIKAADAAAMRAVEAARKAQKRSVVYSIITLVVLVAAVAFVIWNYLLSNKRDLSAQIEIPAGSYSVGDPDAGATRVDLGAFEIDKYEVSIGDYAAFIKYLEEHTDEEHKWDHPASTQRHVRHVTNEVKTLITNAKGRGGAVFKDKNRGEPGVAVDLNCPMVGISWWDAYAYAKWKNRDLPTEEEWEAAARGPRGFKYPWGDELKLGRMNSNDGYQAMKPGSHSPNDGYNYWSAVDIFGDDESPFKVVGMGGNVAEWVYRKSNNKDEALIKGGSFATPPIPMFGRMEKLAADDCWFVWPEASRPAANAPTRPDAPDRFYVGDTVSANMRSLYIGFRTVKRK